MLLRNKYKNLSLLVLTYSHGNFLLYSFDYELIKCLYDKIIRMRKFGRNIPHLENLF